MKSQKDENTSLYIQNKKMGADDLSKNLHVKITVHSLVKNKFFTTRGGLRRPPRLLRRKLRVLRGGLWRPLRRPLTPWR